MQVPSTLCLHSMPVLRAARWFSGVTTSLCCQVSPFPPARNRTAIPALGALIPNTSCATHLLHEGLYMLSAQLAAWFAGHHQHCCSSEGRELLRGLTQSWWPHTPLLNTCLSENSIICGDGQLFSSHLGIRFNCNPKTDFITFQLNGVELCSVINLGQSTDYKASI